MDDENRKKLKRFWRRKLWLGLAAVGAIGLAAWRVSAVQGRYDDVLVQESRELPEKVYQELVAEVRKGVPIVPVIPPGTDVTALTYGRKSRCDAIVQLGYLGDSRAISDLVKLLENDLNRATSCNMYDVPWQESQFTSVFTASATAIAKLKPADVAVRLKKVLSKEPSSDLINVWREMHDRETFIVKGRVGSNTNVDLATSQYKKPLPDFKRTIESERRNRAVIDSTKGISMSSIRFNKLHEMHQKNSINLEDKLLLEKNKSIQEELFKDYANIVFKRQNDSVLPLLVNTSRIGDDSLLDVILPVLYPNYYDFSDRGLSFYPSDGLIIGLRKHLVNPEFRSQFLRRIQKYPLDKNIRNHLFDPTLFQDPPLQNINYSLTQIRIGNLESRTSELYAIKTSLQHGGVDDPHLSSVVVSFLRSLNWTKDIPAEDWIHQNGQTKDSPLVYPMMAWIMLTQKTLNNYPARLDAIEVLEMLVDRNLVEENDRKEAISVLMSIYKNWNSVWNVPDRTKVVRLIRKLNESEKVDRTAQQHTQQLFYLETGVLGAIGVTAIGLLLSSVRLRNPFSLFFSTYLLFPEEVVAELIALKQRRQTEKVRKWQIRLELAYEIIILIWAFQIQIRIDDRKLLPGGNRSAK